MKPLKFRVVKQWPGGPVVGTELPVGSKILGDSDQYYAQYSVTSTTTIPVSSITYKEFLEPLYKKAPEFNGFSMDIEATTTSETETGRITWSQVRAKFGCVRIDIGHLQDAYGALMRGIHVDKGKFSVKGIVIDTPSNGTNLTVPIELIKEIIDYAKEQHPTLV